MASKNDCWGIEVGANAIKAVRLGRSGGQVDVLDYAVLPFKKVLTTPDLNVDEAVQVNLDAFLAKHDVSKSRMVVSVPGHMAFARFAKLPPVEPKKIPDIVRFEAVQQIPFPIEQVEWDYQVFQQEDSPDVEVGIFAITKERVSRFLSNYRRVNLRVDALTLSPIAVYNAYLYEHAEDEQGEGTILMDIGTQSTDVIIVEGGGIWLRTLPIGGNNFTDALVKAFKLSFPKAEKLKREARTSKYARQIFQAMRPVFADLVQEIQRSLGYYQSMNRDADLKRVVGFGSTFRLPGLQKFLKQQLQMDVEKPDPFGRVNVEGKQESEFTEHTLNLATAYGLALQGLGLETVSANILPSAILRQRMWKAKQPWIGAAAACVALAAGLAAGRYFMENSAYESAFAEHNPAVQRVIGEAQRYQSEINEQDSSSSDPRLKIENLRRILDYRDLWPKILEDVSLAAASLNPQPQTLGVDYEAIKSIPRSQRRRVYIDSIRAEYHPKPIDPMAMQQGGGQQGEQVLGESFTTQDFWTGPGEVSAEPEPAIDPLDPDATAEVEEQDDDAPKPQGPYLTITLNGTTPFGDAARFLNKEFIGWLRAHEQRPDRPYKIIVPPDALTGVAKLGASADSPGGANKPGGQQPGAYGPAGGGYPGAGYPGGKNTYGGYPGAAGGYPGAAAGATAARGGSVSADLLPVRPLSEESRANDKRFTIKWIVELQEPEQARRAEHPTPVTPAETIEEAVDQPDAAPEAPPTSEPEQARQPGKIEEVSS